MSDLNERLFGQPSERAANMILLHRNIRAVAGKCEEILNHFVVGLQRFILLPFLLQRRGGLASDPNLPRDRLKYSPLRPYIDVQLLGTPDLTDSLFATIFLSSQVIVVGPRSLPKIIDGYSVKSIRNDEEIVDEG